MESLQAYTEVCLIANRDTDFTEYMAWGMFGIIPAWYEEMLV